MCKKVWSRAKLLFCLSKPITFLPFSLPSPSSLLKLPIYCCQLTGSEDSFLFICLDATRFVLLSVFTRDELPENVSKSLPKNTNPLPVDVRRSWTFLLKLSNIAPRLRAPSWLRSAQPSIREPIQKFSRPSTEEKGSKSTPQSDTYFKHVHEIAQVLTISVSRKTALPLSLALSLSKAQSCVKNAGPEPKAEAINFF